VHEEEILTGGNVAAEVVRIGSTVRKPALPQTPGVEAVLNHLANKGFTGAPATMGLDDRHRHVVEYIPGDLADTLPLMTFDELHRVGGLIRELHDAMEDFAVPTDVPWNVAVPDPAGGDLICHNDLAPWNLVRDGDRWVFIDWDNAGPSCHQTGEQPWSRLYTEGHANHWGPTATYLTKHQNTWLTALM
jgi:hypothetical protein